jgi:valyl-tRNA synthetase
MVRDKEGKKMSKSLGNIIDPIDVIESISLEGLEEKLKIGNLQPSELERATKLQKKQFPDGIPECGTDALRFTLLNFTSANARDINLDVLRINGYRTFCNKMWQTTQFALLNMKDFKPTGDVPSSENLSLSFIDKWILSRLNTTIKNVDKALTTYNFGNYTTFCYDFWYKEVCDIYIEAIKPVMSLGEDSKERKAAQTVLYTCIETVLRLLHPTMPFLTEELWQRLPGHFDLPKEKCSIMVNPYPVPMKEWESETIEQEMDLVQKICGRLRVVKASYTLGNHIKPPVYLMCQSDDYSKLFKDLSSTITTLSFCGEIHILSSSDKKPEGCVIEYIDQFCSAYVLLKGYLNVETEIKKLEKKKQELEKGYANLTKLMSTPKYVNVPLNIKEQNDEKKAKYELDIKNVDEAIEEMKKFN